MKLTKRDKLIKRIDNHLRKTARQLVKFDTEEETLQYLIDSFRAELSCDFVCIVLKEAEYLHPKVWSGGSVSFTDSFPLKIENCSEDLLHHSLTFENAKVDDTCDFTKMLSKEKIRTWFTVPLKDDVTNYGFCIIGFLKDVPLLNEMNKYFIEFGKDVAVAISLAKRKEAQKKKMLGMEWINQNLFLDSSIEKVVEKIVERAGKGTESKVACIYLYDEKENCFTFQPPSYGEINQSYKIFLEDTYRLMEFFPYLETSGGEQLTVPLVVDLKTIGVLHVERKKKGVFTNDDLEVLELLSSHVAAMIENVRLYKNEKDHKQRLHSLLNYQQELVKETVEQENFDGITTTLSKLFSTSVILFDRFMRPISYQLKKLAEAELNTLVEQATIHIYQQKNRGLFYTIELTKQTQISVWPINGGGDLLGYLAIEIQNEEIDDFYRLSVDLARNIYSIQFIKQKLVLDTKEQVKDSFIHKLLVEKLEDSESIIQYANLFQWDLFNQHRVAVLSIELNSKEDLERNILEQQEKKSFLWEQLKEQISIFDKEIMYANKGEEYIIIVPALKEIENEQTYWTSIYEKMKKWVQNEMPSSQLLLGIGGVTKELTDYYLCYQQAVQALNVVQHRFTQEGFALFDQLGAYTVLHDLQNSAVVTLFMKKYLSSLLDYSEGKSTDLFHTLRVFLQNNGSIKDTSEQLFIHRSTLQYRLEKIQSLLELDLNDAEHRFNLMMAYKLNDLFQ